MSAATIARDLARAKAREERLVRKYREEYTAGLWSTNRPLAAACEDAFSEVSRLRALLSAEGVQS